MNSRVELLSINNCATSFRGTWRHWQSTFVFFMHNFFSAAAAAAAVFAVPVRVSGFVSEKSCKRVLDNDRAHMV